MANIQAKVAKIIDNRTLILNAGRNKGVEHGAKFVIISATPAQVQDPDTNEVLGTVSLPKTRVKIVSVEEKYSIAETYEYTTANVGGNFHGPSYTLGKILEPPKIVKRYKTFELADEQKKTITEEQSSVRVGDIAKEITEEF